MMTPVPVPDRKQKWIGLSFGIVVTLLTVHFLINPKPDTQEPFYALDAWAYDRLLIKRNALQSVSDKNLPEIFIITCDEASFSSLQLLDDPRSAQWPWSPALFAQVVNRLDRLGAAVIGIDKLFVEPHLLNELDRPGRLEAQLADACAKHGKTVLASKFEAVRFDEFSEASTIVKPLKILQDASAFGFISLPLDPDGSIRRASSRIQHQERSYDSFASEIVRLYRQTNPSALSSFHHNTFYIAYDGKPFDSFPFFLFVDGLYEQFSDTFFGDNEDDDGFASFDINRFKNSIVLIGATAGELHDVYKSPISVQPIPGVEIHANIVKTLLSENFLNPVGDRLQRWMVLILTAAICILYSFVSIRVGLLGSFIGVVGWIAGGSFALLYGGTVVRIVTPAVCLGLAPIASFAFRYFSELRTLADYLEKRVEERTAQLETANHELKKSQLQLIQSEKMASLGQLVAGIAHEINNPINFIRSNIEPLKDYLTGFNRMFLFLQSNKDRLPDPIQDEFDTIGQEEDLDEASEDSLKIIQSFKEGSLRIERIVTDLREYIRIDTDALSHLNMKDALETSLSILSNRFKDSVSIHKEYRDIPAVVCSPGRINQVFMNLLSNALDAIEEGGNIWVTTGREDERVEVIIRDDGKGIPAGNLSKVFDPFFTTKPVGSGTGLGLSLSYGIVEQHGGKLTVESEEGKGTAFTVSLPIDRRKMDDRSSTKKPNEESA